MPRIVVITGGTTGIGFAAAERFLRGGDEVVVTGRDRERVAAAAERLGAGATGIVCDMESLDDIRGLRDRLRREHGRIDVLFVNAGVLLTAPFAEVTPELFDEQFAVNVRGPFFTVQALVPLMPSGSVIVVTTSNLSEMGPKDFSAYSATKAALRSLVRSIAGELAPAGIRVNAVAPGPTRTPQHVKLGLGAEALAAVYAGLAEQIPVGRIGAPEEIAEVVAFLASDASSFMTAEEVVVDGGWREI